MNADNALNPSQKAFWFLIDQRMRSIRFYQRPISRLSSYLDLICFYFIVDGVAKSPPYGVTAFFQDLDIPDVCLRP
jgi:hypothetical protein